jgi:hypothetical protein
MQKRLLLLLIKKYVHVFLLSNYAIVYNISLPSRSSDPSMLNTSGWKEERSIKVRKRNVILLRHQIHILINNSSANEFPEIMMILLVKTIIIIPKRS